jgi:hypothetical protein
MLKENENPFYHMGAYKLKPYALLLITDTNILREI